MGEAVAHHSGQRLPNGHCGSLGAGLFGAPGSLPPFGRRHLHHAAEQPGLGAAAQQHRPVRPGQPKRDPAPQRPRPLGRPARQFRGQARQPPPAVRGQGTGPAARALPAGTPWRPDPSAPGPGRRRERRRPAPPVAVPRRAGAAPPWPRAGAPRPRNNAPSPARRCRLRPPRGGQRRWRRPPPRCRGRCRARHVGPPRYRGSDRHGRRRSPARRRAGCAPGHSSRARPRRRARRRETPPPSPRPGANAPESPENRARRSPPWSATA